jgi:hypothetical protein
MYNTYLMKEQPSGATRREVQIGPDQKGLIAAYLEAKSQAEKHTARAKMFKDAIVDRVNFLANDYKLFMGELFADIKPAVANHPIANNRRHLGKPKESTETFEKQLSVEGEKETRKIVYKRMRRGGVIEREFLRIERPNRPVWYMSVNFSTHQLEMRDSRSMQTLAHGEPHIIPLTDEKNSKYSDILDTFAEELRLLKAAK